MAEYKLIIIESAIVEIEDACLYYNDQLVGLGFEFEEEIFTPLFEVSRLRSTACHPIENLFKN